MKTGNYDVIQSGQGFPVKMWTQGVPVDEQAKAQLNNTALLPFIHRRIAYLGSSVATSVTEDRYGGYADTLARHGVAADPALIRSCLPRWTDAKEAMLQLLALRAPPTALVCFNDLLALGAMLAVSETGRIPGRDFAIVGYDDIELAAAWRPGLTTVAVRPREMGREAGRMLLERIGGAARPPQRVLLAPRLVIRESCGASLSCEVQ